MDQLLLEDRDFRNFYHNFSIEKLANNKNNAIIEPIEIDAEEHLLAS